MPNFPLVPTDDIVGPTTDAIANLFSTQITGVGRVYNEPPDGPPENGSIMLPLVSFENYQAPHDAPVGKEYIKLTYCVHYVVRRSQFSQNILACYQMTSAIWRILSAWPNQDLGGLATAITPKRGGFTQWVQAGTPYVALLVYADVLTEFNVFTSA